MVDGPSETILDALSAMSDDERRRMIEEILFRWCQDCGMSKQDALGCGCYDGK